MSPGSGADAVDMAVVEVVQADGEPFRPRARTAAKWH